MLFLVPDRDKLLNFPSLGPQIVDWMQENLVFGPGDKSGEPYVLDAEKKQLLYCLYQVFPQGHPREGRRRFKRAVVSMRKGTAKTEFAAAITLAELHPYAPVRCYGFDDEGQPLGSGVRDPYVPLTAYTEEQSDELIYTALRNMLSESIARDFDVGLDRILVLGDGGKAQGKAAALATAPNARDGARTTFQVFDESHRLVLERMKQAHQVMQQNIPKRKAADAWTLEITTSYLPGEGSVAEDAHDFAKMIAEGKASDDSFFFYHRQASDHHDLETAEGMRAAIEEASGPAVLEWTDVDTILSLGQNPKIDRSYWERVWLNRVVAGSRQAFNIPKFDQQTSYEYKDWRPATGSIITIGFDGSRVDDSTAVWGTDFATKRQFRIGLWERPLEIKDWEVPADEVDAVIEDAFQRWNVGLFYGDPYWWEMRIASWQGRFGKYRGRPRVHAWHTNRAKAMALACRSYATAIEQGELSHNGDLDLKRHLAHAYKHYLNLYTDEGERLWVIRKERPDSPHKIDAAMAAILSWEAHKDLTSLGVVARSSSLHMF